MSGRFRVQQEHLSCPMCGGANTVVLNAFFPLVEDKDQRSGVQVECNDCSCFFDIVEESGTVAPVDS